MGVQKEQPKDTKATKNAFDLPTYSINRDVLKHEEIITKSGYKARDKSLKFALGQCWLTFSCLRCFTDYFPIITWLPKYKVKKYLMGDLISGATVAIMQIPQGLAYGLLAGVTARVGLYMAFFPVLVYAVLGTSKHISIGTFAVVSMMTLKVVQTHASLDPVENGTLSEDQSEVYTPAQVATATAFLTGLIHIGMHVLRLGMIASLLSESLIQGFTTAAAFHVIISQLKDAFGVHIKRYKGPFKLIYTLIDFFPSLANTNLIAFGVFAGVFIFMMISNEIIKPRWNKRVIIPFPAELLTVVGGTLISKYTNIGEIHNVKLVGDIPTGLPYPELPPFSLFPKIVIDCLAIAIVTYSVVISMSFIFAKKHSYQISPNQELFAMGIANIIGGMFSCIPVTCSLSRSIIQEQTGGKTQITSVIAASFILIILLWIGPFFQSLPRCVLAGIIIVALKGMLMQFKDLKRVSKEGKLELLTWLSTFFGVILIDIDYGLLIGFLTSVLALYIKGWKATSSILGTLPGTGIYVNLNNHRNAIEIPAIKIFRYSGYINFATESSFKKNLYEAIEMKPELLSRSSLLGVDTSTSTTTSVQQALLPTFKVLILDMSTVSHLDVAATKELSEVLNEMDRVGVKVFFSNPQDHVYDTLIHGMELGEGPFEIYPTIHDAVLYAKAS